MDTTNKLYLIGVKCPLPQLAECVGLVDTYEEYPEQEIAYMGFWDKVCIIEYNQITKQYTVKENLIGEPHYFCTHSEEILFKYMDDNNIEFIMDPNPLGEIFTSYAAAYLELVRWAADVAYIRDRLYNLMEE